MQKNILIVGGTSGIGLELARHYTAVGHRVCVVGRHEPELHGVQFFPLPITASSEALTAGVDALVTAFPGVQTLI